MKVIEEEMQTPPGGVALPQRRRPSWFTRHWKWAVLIGCLSMVILVAMFVGAIFSVVE